MKKPDRIPVNKNLIPYQFNIVLTGTLFTLRFDYNKLHDFFTVSLSKGGKDIICGEKIVYGQKLFNGVFLNNGDFPACDIIPLDLSGRVDEVNWETFCEDVFLWIDNAEESISEQ